MYKYKKLTLNIITVLYILIFLVELVKYFIIDNTLYGLIYLLINLLIIFFASISFKTFRPYTNIIPIAFHFIKIINQFLFIIFSFSCFNIAINK